MAGKGHFRVDVSYILEVFCTAGASVTVYMTAYSGHATNLAKNYGGNYDIVCCMGGDGTLAETIAGLMELERRPPVGYIPMGTTNDMANTLGLPKEDARQAADIIAEGRLRAIDVGLFNQQYFSYIAAFGAFTEVAYETSRESKQMMGHMAYVLEGLGRLGKIRPQRLKVHYNAGGEVEGDFIFGAVSNTTSIAGVFKLKPDLVDLGDGAFEVILVKNPLNILEFNQMFFDLVTKKYDTEHVQVFRARDVRFEFESPVAWTLDGESGGVHRAVSLHALQPGVEIFVP